MRLALIKYLKGTKKNIELADFFFFALKVEQEVEGVERVAKKWHFQGENHSSVRAKRRRRREHLK